MTTPREELELSPFGGKPELPSATTAELPAPTALPTNLTITHRSRFTLANNASVIEQARTVLGRVLPLMLGRSDDGAQLTVQRVQTCLMDLVAFARSRTRDDSMLCEVWLDQQHVFVSAEHTRPAAVTELIASRYALASVGALADDYGTHGEQDAFQTWAAIRIS